MNIDKGVPIPRHRNSRYAGPWPFAQMQVGDSFTYPMNGANLHTVAARLTYAAKRYAEHDCASFRVVVRLDPTQKDAVRCWRVEPSPARAPVVHLAQPLPPKPASYVHRLSDEAPRSGRPGRAK